MFYSSLQTLVRKVVETRVDTTNKTPKCRGNGPHGVLT